MSRRYHATLGDGESYCSCESSDSAVHGASDCAVRAAQHWYEHGAWAGEMPTTIDVTVESDDGADVWCFTVNVEWTPTFEAVERHGAPDGAGGAR